MNVPVWDFLNSLPSSPGVDTLFGNVALWHSAPDGEAAVSKIFRPNQRLSLLPTFSFMNDLKPIVPAFENGFKRSCRQRFAALKGTNGVSKSVDQHVRGGCS
jgi:hypothetical protein